MKEEHSGEVSGAANGPEDPHKYDLNARIAKRVRELRAAQGLSLEALATRTGVSRSMLSLIERGESSATAVVLEKLAAGLGVALASLFDAPSAEAEPVSRRASQVQWRDPASGYVRRNVSPAGNSPIQIVDVEFPRVLAWPTSRAHGGRSFTSRCGCSRARSMSRLATSSTA